MFSKTEKKKSSAPLFITVGALMVIGAASVMKKSKEVIDGMCKKLEGGKSDG